MVRLLDLPGMRSLESALILGLPPKSPDEPTLAERLDVVSKQLFGITESETYIGAPESDAPADWTRYDLLWEEREAVIPEEAYDHPDTIAFFRARGWDVTDDFGQVARVLEHFYEQILLTEAGVAGLKATSSLAGWQNELERQAEGFTRKRKAEPWKPYPRKRR